MDAERGKPLGRELELPAGPLWYFLQGLREQATQLLQSALNRGERPADRAERLLNSTRVPQDFLLRIKLRDQGAYHKNVGLGLLGQRRFLPPPATSTPYENQ